MLEWAGATFVKLTISRLDRNWYLFWLLSARLRVVKRLRNSHSDGLMTLYEKICFVVCIFWHMPSIFYASLSCSYWLLYLAFLLFFGVFCNNVVIINAMKHQKLTKTLNNVINSSMKHKCRWHMSEYTLNNAYSFINCHQTIRMIISKPFHDSQCCW